jgi:hypothetical protein
MHLRAWKYVFQAGPHCHLQPLSINGHELALSSNLTLPSGIFTVKETNLISNQLRLAPPKGMHAGRRIVAAQAPETKEAEIPAVHAQLSAAYSAGGGADAAAFEGNGQNSQRSA